MVSRIRARPTQILYRSAGTLIDQEKPETCGHLESFLRRQSPQNLYPYSPSVMQQREGRIDRYMSQQVRDAIEEYGVDDSVEKLEGLHPEFTVVSDEGERLNAPNRFVLHLPFSSQLRTWNKCLQRMYYSDLLIGHPDPLAIEKEIRNRIDEVDEVKLKDLYDKLKELFVDLKPKPQSLKKAS